MTLPGKSESPVVVFGRGLHEHGYNCCGKPKGCTNMNPQCAHLNHPYKKWVRGEITLKELGNLIPLD